MIAKYRNDLPQLNGKQFLTDGGLETCLIFHDGFELPLFAAFPLMNSEDGSDAIDRYLRRYAEIAIRDRKGFVLDTPTWRASSRWANELRYSAEALRDVHKTCLERAISLREELENPNSPFVINGGVGPQDDGYNPQTFMSVEEARDYHAEQVRWFKEFGADMTSAITICYVEEAIGFALAAKQVDMPAVLSFTVETDGKLPSGQPLGEAIEQVDQETGGSPAYFMINCAHPDHFTSELAGDANWKSRIMGLRANASRMSHEELDNAIDLDDGNPAELGEQYRELRKVLPNLNVLGGCCGTDHRHVDCVSIACGVA